MDNKNEYDKIIEEAIRKEQIDTQAQKAYKATCARAEKIINDRDQVEDLLKRLQEKLSNLPVLGDALTYLPKMGLLINSYIKGEYTAIPIGIIVAVVGAVLYFVLPIDFLPDFIPAAGLLDDAAVVAIALSIAKTDIDEYMSWRNRNGLDDQFVL